MKGIDISVWQGDIDFDAIQKAVEFVIIRSSYGNGGRDNKFARNRDEARRRDIPRGYYHYAYPQYNSPEAEANWFADVVGGLQQGEVVVLDFEEKHNNPVDWCLRFLKTAEARFGVKPMIYINLALNNALDWSPVVSGNYGLWLAHWTYNDGPAVVTDWPFTIMRQYTSDGTIPGYNGRLDMNVFYGDVATFKRYGKQGGAAPAPTPPVPAPQPVTDVYTIKSGDNLSAIAARFGMSLGQLLDLNPGFKANPNLIFPGQQVRVKGSPAPAPAPQEQWHTVVSGDNLSAIASRYGISLGQLLDMNSQYRANPNLIYPGQRVRVK